MEAFQRDEWRYIGVYVTTNVSITFDKIFVLADEITSAIFGIESDSDQDYLNSLIKDLMDEQRERLRAIGFPDEEINQSFAGMKEIDV